MMVPGQYGRSRRRIRTRGSSGPSASPRPQSRRLPCPKHSDSGGNDVVDLAGQRSFVEGRRSCKDGGNYRRSTGRCRGIATRIAWDTGAITPTPTIPAAPLRYEEWVASVRIRSTTQNALIAFGDKYG